MVGHVYHTTSVMLWVHMYITLHPRQKTRTNRHCACVWDGFVDGGTRISHHNRAKDSPRVYYASSAAKTKTKRHCACVWMGLQMVGTRISHHNRAKTVHVYIYASSTAKTKTKRHCACVWMGLQMVGHVYHTTIALRQSTCILRLIHGKIKDKTPLRMRVDGFADGGTRISHHNRALSCMSLSLFRESHCLFVCHSKNTLYYIFNFLYILTIVLHDWPFF